MNPRETQNPRSPSCFRKSGTMTSVLSLSASFFQKVHPWHRNAVLCFHSNVRARSWAVSFRDPNPAYKRKPKFKSIKTKTENLLLLIIIFKFNTVIQIEKTKTKTTYICEFKLLKYEGTITLVMIRHTSNLRTAILYNSMKKNYPCMHTSWPLHTKDVKNTRARC